MNIDRRTTKIYLKSLPPLTAIKLINDYRLPSPWKEVLICACVDCKEGYAGIDYLAEHYKIHLGYWTFSRKLKQALDKFHKAHLAEKVPI